MKNLIALSVIALSFGLWSCQDSKVNADELINQSIKAHRLDLLEGKKVDFDFRDRSYWLVRADTGYSYARITVKEEDTITDILDRDGNFMTFWNDFPTNLPDTTAAKYSRSVNSVLYFFQIPLVLNDPAVNSEYLGETDINGADYHSLIVTFSEEGGGEDFEDEFRYWINKESMEVDYLAYSYLTDGGGVRFREAINKRKLGGILFQDYRNFKPENKNTSLDSLPMLFESGKLKLLSTIENKNIKIEDIGGNLVPK